MNITTVQPRISYYTGGGEKYPMDSILFLAENNSSLNFTIYTTKQETKETMLYKKFKEQVKNISNIDLIELNVPDKFKFLYEIEAGENRYRWDMESMFFSNLVLNEILRQAREPDIIWSYYILDFPFKLNGVKTVLNLLGYPRVKSEYREAILSQYDLIVSINQNIVKKWNDLLDVKIDKYECLRLGINKMINHNQIGIIKEFGRFDILYVGRLIERKGVLELCKTVQKIITESPQIRLHILGEGPLEDTLKKYINDNHLNENIFILGFKSNVANYYSSADVCVFPSFPGEGQMSTVLEAIYFNGNVITTTGNNNEEYIENGVSGFLFNSDNFSELEGLLLDQINQRIDLAKIKDNAKNNIKDNDWEKYAKKFIAISRKLISGDQ